MERPNVNCHLSIFPEFFCRQIIPLIFAYKDTKIGIIGLYKNHQSFRHNSEIKMPFDTWVQFEIMASPGGGSGVIHASANAGPGGGAGAGNPRKFAEKIQILNIKGAEETSEFEKIMSECAAVRAGHQPESGPHPTDSTKVPYFSAKLLSIKIQIGLCKKGLKR